MLPLHLIFILLQFFVSFTNSQTCTLIGISESPIDGSIKEMEWISDQGIVFALTVHDTLYRSDDNGKSWQDQREHLSTETPKVKGIFPAGAGSSKVYFLGPSNRCWTTSDGGKTYELRTISVSDPKINLQASPIMDLLPHPTETDWVLAVDSENLQNVFYSKDFGQSWALLSTLVSQYFWPTSSTFENPITGPYILNYQVDEKTNLDLLRIEGLSQLIGYDSNFSKKKILAQNIKQMNVFGERFAAIMYAGGSASNATLEFSADGGFTWESSTFTDSLNISNQVVKIMEISSYKMYISVSENGKHWTNLYSGDLKDMIFSVSLKYVVLPESEEPEMAKIPRLTGTYLAKSFLTPDPLIPTKFGSSPVTSITYTQGSSWKQLFPSTQGENGCSGLVCPAGTSCGLHFGVFNPEQFLAPETDAGLIIAVGNVGCYDLDQKGLYLSRDGGWNWKELAKQRQVFDIADHGGYLVFTSLRNPTNTFSYSIDYGATTHTCPFTSEEFEYRVEGFFSASNSTAASFVMSAYNNTHHVLFLLDFTEYFSQECIGANHPGDSSSDYEFWSPTHEPTLECLNGETLKFGRRRAKAQCYNPEKVEPLSESIPCPCDVHDYECGWCFERSGEQCVPMTSCSVSSLYQEPAHCDTTWTKQSEYQKLPGNKCTGPIFQNEQVPCSGESSDSDSDSESDPTKTIIIPFVVFLFIAFFLTVAFFFWRRRYLSAEYKHKKIERSVLESDTEELDPL